MTNGERDSGMDHVDVVDAVLLLDGIVDVLGVMPGLKEDWERSERGDVARSCRAGDGLPTVEEWRGLGVLFLLKRNDQLEIGPVAVHRELRTERACRRGVPAEPVKRRLTTALNLTSSHRSST